MSIGPIHWVYLPEILNDQQWGLVSSVHYANGVWVSVITEYMIEYMKPEGTFLFYSIITFFGIFFFVFVVKETRGLSDKEKKLLYYSPDLGKRDQELAEKAKNENDSPEKCHRDQNSDHAKPAAPYDALDQSTCRSEIEMSEKGDEL